MQKLFTYIFLIGFIGLSLPVYGSFDALERVRFHGFDGEGSFVEYPAYVGSSSGYVFGLIPAVSITEPQRLANYDQAGDRLGGCILSGFSKTFSIFFGSFPYVLKKGFWDFPKLIVAGGSSDYYEYKPTPVPEVKVDPRLLQEEKHTDLNLQEKSASPTLVDVPEAHKKIEVVPAPVLKTMEKVKSISVAPVSVEKASFPEVIPVSDTQKVTLRPIPAEANISGGYSIDTGKGEDNSQKWESSGLPDWVKKQVSQ